MEIAIPIRLFNGIDIYSPVKTGNKWAFLAIRQDRNAPVETDVQYLPYFQFTKSKKTYISQTDLDCWSLQSKS